MYHWWNKQFFLVQKTLSKHRKNIENVRIKKKQLAISVIFIGNKKMESLKQRCLKILVGDSKKP